MASSNPMKISLCVSLNIFVFVSSPRLNYKNYFVSKKVHQFILKRRRNNAVEIFAVECAKTFLIHPGSYRRSWEKSSASVLNVSFDAVKVLYERSNLVDSWILFPYILTRDAPVCIQEREEVYGALKQETVTLRCRVDANPPVAAFHWTFNNSGDQTDVSSEKYTNEVTSSRLNYTPNNDLDYAPFPSDVTSSETVAHCWKLDIHFKETDLEHTANIST
ncbi:hypothetical protein HUJ04_004810 [Dendroctonus ponderosae]|nr:hypothetical protein HUJ04_004810 [Dendroctonus ponderosae]